MAKAKSSRAEVAADVSPSTRIDDMLMAALERGDDSLQTGRFLVTFKEGAAAEGQQAFEAQGMRVANARDFENQAATLESVGDADAMVFPEIGVGLVGSVAAHERGMTVAAAEGTAESVYETVEPEYFVFSESTAAEYLRGFLRAAETIAKDLAPEREPMRTEPDEEAAVLGATWGLTACKVPTSLRSGAGIRVAVLDTGMDLGHPDFVGRSIVSQTFVGQPVQDLHSHGTHCIGTACGPRSPAGTTPRYGVGYLTSIYVGKVLSNSGSSVGGSVLAGMNWAIANRCQVISLSLGSQVGPQSYYTAAGQAALNNGLLMIAAAGNAGSSTGAPANSPTIMSVASLDANLQPSYFSNFGKIDIAAPGRDVFSSIPRPNRYGIKSGTSMAAPHVAGCAALWAQTSTSLRGINLWRRLQATARSLPLPATRVGAGLVQAP